MADNKLKIGITQGDTNGIGWEVILKTFADNRLAELFTPVIYGSPSVAAFYRNRISGLDEFQFNIIGSVRDARRGRVNLVVCGQKEIRVTPGEASAEGGRAAVDALQCAMRDLKEEALDALVTAPIDKQTAQCDDFRHTGHKGSRKHDAVGSEQDAGKTVHWHKAETFFSGHDGNAAATQVQLSAVFGYFKDEIRHVFLKKGSLPRIFCMGNEPFRDVIKQ